MKKITIPIFKRYFYITTEKEEAHNILKKYNADLTIIEDSAGCIYKLNSLTFLVNITDKQLSVLNHEIT